MSGGEWGPADMSASVSFGARRAVGPVSYCDHHRDGNDDGHINTHLVVVSEGCAVVGEQYRRDCY